MNSQEFTANSAFVTIKCVAYNIVQCFKQHILEDVWQTKSFKTIKNYLIKIPCNVFKYCRGIRVSLPFSYQFKEVFSAV
ncbi:MAG: hypothetical protein AYP45_15420 [Candidatus Brocadia carolinensis]|uniref:Transposase DDE domain-containing protein n=1 Tax=Candidatus Brocadia carolinensis TaxID=1004156 RepID=A0A1V4AQD4_9BACT|nr:MAG: hypothetical protein AYP45_15420 [Candidatus Brocadia caroliniensis]